MHCLRGTASIARMQMYRKRFIMFPMKETHTNYRGLWFALHEKQSL